MADIQMAAPVNSAFMQRVTSLPSVEAAIGAAVSSYNKIKEYSPEVVIRALEATESTGSLALSSSAPLFEKFAGPIQYVDQLACQTLDKVEEKAPIVKESPAEIFEQVKQYGYDKMNSAKEMVPYPSTETVTEYTNQMAAYAATALTAADAALGQHLVSCGVEVQEAEEGEITIRTKVDQISSKATMAVKHHASAKLEVVQKVAQDGLKTVTESLQVVNALRNGVKEGKPLDEIVLTLNMEWLSEILKKSKDQQPAQQAMFVAQAVASRAHEALIHTASQFNERLSAAYTRVASIATSLTTSIPLNAASFEALTTQLSQMLQQHAAHLQVLIGHLTSRAQELQLHLPEIIARNLPKPAVEDKPAAEEDHSKKE
jgi:hypothetical protein